MSALTPRLVAEIMRQRLGLPDASQAARITSQIPQALKKAGRQMAGDPTTRALMVTDKTVAKIAITGDGKCPLATAYTTHYIIKEFLDHGQMYFLPTITFLSAAVATNTITVGTTERWKIGDKIRFTTTGSLPTGLSLATDYYVKTFDTTTGAMTLAATAALGTVVGITAASGSGTHTITTFESADFPLQALAGGPQAEPHERYLAGMFRYYYIQGDTLQVLPRSAAGSVAFAVPSYPATLAALPESEEAQNIFLDVLAEMLTNIGMGK